MTTTTEIKARRQEVLAAVEDAARADGIKGKQAFLTCRDRITAAFGEAGLLDGVGGLNRQVMLAEFAALMADRLNGGR